MYPNYEKMEMVSSALLHGNHLVHTTILLQKLMDTDDIW